MFRNNDLLYTIGLSCRVLSVDMEIPKSVIIFLHVFPDTFESDRDLRELSKKRKKSKSQFSSHQPSVGQTSATKYANPSRLAVDGERLASSNSLKFREPSELLALKERKAAKAFSSGSSARKNDQNYIVESKLSLDDLHNESAVLFKMAVADNRRRKYRLRKQMEKTKPKAAR